MATYELKEKLGDFVEDAHAMESKTAQVARQNRRDEEAMAKKIASKWDKFVDLTLDEAGIDAPKKRRTAQKTGSGSSSRSRR
jgi:hypothetical protein